jgi:hypothetical protein
MILARNWRFNSFSRVDSLLQTRREPRKEIYCENPTITPWSGSATSRHRQPLLILSMLAVMITSNGCNYTGSTPLPPLNDSHEFARLVVIRKTAVVGAITASPVALDGRKVYNLGNGEHIEMKVSAGLHSVSVSPATLALSCEAERTYYLLHVVGDPILHRLAEEEGRSLLATTQGSVLN